jgi:hypothetical protein
MPSASQSSSASNSSNSSAGIAVGLCCMYVCHRRGQQAVRIHVWWSHLWPNLASALNH